MKNTLVDCAIVWEPHFMSRCFRAALHNQKGKEWNYIVITCSPSWNGVWRYKSEQKEQFDRVNNNKNVCLCVPWDRCEKFMELKDVKKQSVQKLITDSQKQFCKQYRKKEQEWVINYAEIQPDIQ